MNWNVFSKSRNACQQPYVLRHFVALIGLVAFLSGSSSAFGHDEFKEAMEQKYRLKSISCKACHTGNKDKKIRNAFGKLLYAELKPKQITEKYKAAKAESEEAEEMYEQQMKKEFLEALAVVEKKQLTFAALIEAGLLNGTRLDKNQVNEDELTVTLVGEEKNEDVVPATPDSKASEPANKPGDAPVIEGHVEQIQDDKPTAKPEAKPATETLPPADGSTQ